MMHEPTVTLPRRRRCPSIVPVTARKVCAVGLQVRRVSIGTVTMSLSALQVTVPCELEVERPWPARGLPSRPGHIQVNEHRSESEASSYRASMQSSRDLGYE
jgi:hypothetical protein